MNNIKTTLFLSIIMVIITTSCSTKIRSLKSDQDIYLQENEGYLLMAIDTSIDLNNIFIIGEKNIMLSKEDLEAGTNYILVNLPVGRYEFDQIKLNNYWRLTLKQDIWDFYVKPNTVSYIGHFKFKNFFSGLTTKLALENKSTDALEFMKEKFPRILTAKKMAYGRSEPDMFFDLVLNKKGK